MSADEKLRFDDLPDRLLAWYDEHARDLPWRIGPKARAAGAQAEPYRVWLAEIMLQQTTVPHAARYYEVFTQRWPQVADLAAAEDDDVMAAWAGLGYYARARNLLKCAREVVARGGWPDSVTGLLELPGIGPYTAGAVGALAFNCRASAVDGNVERVFARLLAAEGAWTQEKARIRDVVDALVPKERSAQFAEALMDLGATICTPRRPNCAACPLHASCQGLAGGAPERFPLKPKNKDRPRRFGHVYVLLDGDQRVRTERRPAKGLLGGMLGLPGSDWIEQDPPGTDFPVSGDWKSAGQVRHVFTHFSLELTVWHSTGCATGTFTPVEEAAKALPSVFAKALALVVN